MLFLCVRFSPACPPASDSMGVFQEAGNVPYVTDNHFGLYRKDPKEIAHEVSDLLADRVKLEAMGNNARSMGRPHATLDIARSLVSTMLPGTAEVGPPSSPTTTSV